MMIQAIFPPRRLLAPLTMLLLAVTARPALANCFDFGKKVIVPLQAPLPLQDGKDNTAYGKYDSDITWAKLRGTVKKPIAQVLNLLLDHNNTKSPRVDEMKVDKKDDPNYLARHTVYFKIKPFLFITVDWKEDWAYALASGTVKEPERIVISYQKIWGTSHIEHLCGNLVLNKLGADSTDVYEYEEAKATQRSPKDTLGGLAGTMRTLRK